MKTINVAVVGKGSMGRTHSASISLLKYCYKNMPFEVKLHTLVTRKEETARADADALGFENYALTFDEAVNNPEIDVIDICTPNICHYEEVKKAVLAGKHVLCEKPLGISAAEADELAALAEKSDKICGMVFNNRHLPATLRAKALVEEGRIGDVVTFRSAYLHSSSTDPNKPHKFY